MFEFLKIPVIVHSKTPKNSSALPSITTSWKSLMTTHSLVMTWQTKVFATIFITVGTTSATRIGNIFYLISQSTDSSPSSKAHLGLFDRGKKSQNKNFDVPLVFLKTMQRTRIQLVFLLAHN